MDIPIADFLISVGSGIAEEENLQLIEIFAELTGATIFASRPIVDDGWQPKNRQVDQSGKIVTGRVRGTRHIWRGSAYSREEGT